MQRFKTMVNISVAVGLGCFLGWRESLVALLYPVSNGLVFSPLVCQSFASCLVLAVALLGVAKNRGSFSSRLLNAASAACVAVATAAGVALATAGPAAPLAFVGAAVIGAASAMLLYAWADVVAGLDPGARVGTALAALAVSSLIGVVGGQFVAGALRVVIVVLGALTFAGFFLITRTLRAGGGETLVIRPASSNHFKLLMLAVVLYALVFGSVSGTTAMQASPLTTQEFMLGMNWAMLAVSLALLALVVLVGRPVSLAVVGRFLTPVLALLFLLHILLGGSANGWLPRLTLGFWQLVQVFVLLVLIEVAQSGTASLSFTFPLGWAVVSLGFACGALAGQVTDAVFGNEEAAVQSITVVLTIIAVVASSILAAAQYPVVSKARAGAPAPEGGGSPVEKPAAPDAVRTDALGAACRKLADRSALSEREREVLDLLARGNTRASIADKLCISENTVRVHVKNIYGKLHIHSKQQLIDMVDHLVETDA